MRLEVGMVVLNRFRVEKLHDQGGMARVYRARHLKLGTPVALKVLTFDNDAELIERFHREAQMMAKVQHPNVVQILDFGMVGGEIPCIAMEYVEGEPLDLRLSRRGALPWEEAVELTLGILSGLDAAHHAEVLHRDLKPENVIVVPGTPERPKLIDFGIAQHDVAFDAKLTQHGETVGTPAYMSPEQLYGLQLDPRSDVYSAGLVLYELLTQDLPNPADATEAIAIRVTTPLPYPTPPPGRPAVPRPLADAIFRALAPEPADRPASARQFAQELRDVRRELRRRKRGVRPSGGPSLRQPSGAGRRSRPSPPPRSDTFAPTPPPAPKAAAPAQEWTPPVWARAGSRWAERPPSNPKASAGSGRPTPAAPPVGGGRAARAVSFRSPGRPPSQPAPPEGAPRPAPSPRVTQAYGSRLRPEAPRTHQPSHQPSHRPPAASTDPPRPNPPPGSRTEAREAPFGQGDKRSGAEAWPRHVERPSPWLGGPLDAAQVADPKPRPAGGGGLGPSPTSAPASPRGTAPPPGARPSARAPSTAAARPRPPASPLRAPGRSQEEQDRQVALARVAALRAGAGGASAATPGAAAPQEGRRVRLIVVAKVPRTLLRLQSEQRWLQEAGGPGAERGFEASGAYWIFPIEAEDDAEAEASAQRFAVQLGARYGAEAGARWARVDGPVSMSPRSLPPLVQGLMHYVSMK